MSSKGMTLPKAPRDLCFTELDFVQDDFNVDAFLQEHKNTTKLERMRDDLGIYLKLLRSAMIDLINRDYTDFVKLSSSLIGVDKAINDLQVPVGQLKEEVMQVRQTLDDEIKALSSSLSACKKIRESKRSLESLQHVYKILRKLSSMLSMNSFIESLIKIDILEQSAAEFNVLKFHISRCKMHISQDQEKESQELEIIYMSYLNKFLLACIHEKDRALLVRSLRIYVTINKISEAEKLVREEVIRPISNKIICEENVQSDVLGLQSIYHELLNILNVELKELLDITLHPNKLSVKGFNFLVCSFWVEIEEKIEQYIKCIFAPGDPVLFHRRYIATLEFLAKLEEECITDAAFSTLKEHPQYNSFLKKWNLPVYFQIRFQEIAGTVERVLAEPISPNLIQAGLDSLTEKSFSLLPTCVVWDNLHRIWADDVYLYQLFHRFWKFSLQMCSRYQTWCRDALNQVWSISNASNVLGGQEHYNRLNFLIYLYVDIEKVIQMLPDFLQIVHSKLKMCRPAVFTLLKDTLGETSKHLVDILPQITEHIVSELLKECVQHLKQVNDIPRLFRRTKREIPSKPCAYVKNTLSFLNHFNLMYDRVIPKHVNHWLELTLSSVTKIYHTAVTDVLTSVQKTEESLKRLKKIRDKATSSFPSETQGTTDDEKIRIQLQVDVHNYTEMIAELKVSTLNIHHLGELMQAVEAAVKK
ncbi:hypothetical protein KM043_017562 [Ampulex compressa]|nr:hypothetical protein KM043_017562 [Ampulex compressa]